MSIITITDNLSGSTARIAPELGFNCFEFHAVVDGKTFDVLDAMPGFEAGGQKPTASGIPILFPFPNRIRAGKFNWEGREYVLPCTDDFGNAIHGLCMDRPWRVVRQADDFVTGQFRLSVDAPDRMSLWPADFVIEVDYELVRSRLRSRFRISNASNQKLPWGLGTHPFFKLPLGRNSTVDDCVVEVPAGKRWELVDCLPTGRQIDVNEDDDLRDGAYISTLKLDDVYTGIEIDGPQFDCLIVDEREGLQVVLTCPPIFRDMVVFTPPNRKALCIEPYTCPTDAINLRNQNIDTGWRVLNPGQEFHTWIDLSVTKVVA